MIRGIPEEILKYEEIYKEQQVIRVRLERRHRRRDVTIIDGIDEKSVDLKKLATELKSRFACGGTAKNGRIELQGDHRSKVKKVLVELGFSPDNIIIE
ncbi:MAG: stress response translation initiation inhibitor YciH [Thermoprotei archaeon]|nr:MAG: stress response translation initiation inhibitor YciH [Thermoprotei archaeon]HDD63541.1 stress response translation initiation inhibitor YciH [Thermoprotei archaeon]